VADTARIAKIADPQKRAKAVNSMIDELQTTIAELSRLRRDTLEELLEAGMSQTQIAETLGMSRSRVSQLLSAGVRPERAFLGTGRLTVAIGGKQEIGRHDPGDVLSAESFAAYEILSEVARTVGLDASYEVVPRPGHVHLNRANLIVLTNPRLLPFLSQVMEADPHLRYVRDEGGWYLVDITTDTEYRSPRDQGVFADYGYVGRLPRPDGKGTFLYLAGTHAQGTLGAAQYVADNFVDLYRELKTRRFSTIVLCRYDPTAGPKILKTERATPIYRHEST
jgi:Sigma-70, region 4